MIIYSGKNKAYVMIDCIDSETAKQIVSIINHQAFNTDCVIMPDCHAGKGCVIGYTRQLEDNIVPNLIGVDISCGVSCLKLRSFDHNSIDFKKLDEYIRKAVPIGHNIHNFNVFERYKQYSQCAEQTKEICKIITNNDHHKFCKLWARVNSSIGTCGGGNHFVSLDKDKYGDVYISIHSGSRYFGKMIAEYYQQKAVEFCKQFNISVTNDQAYLPLEYGADDYIKAMKVAQLYAQLNRQFMLEVIEIYFVNNHTNSPSTHKTIESVHNYIDFSDNVIRKGAISAHLGQKLVIPLNMRDGIILGTGKGNTAWNCSAPHGAGRNFSRSQAKKTIDLTDYQLSMTGIFSTSVNQSTLDESPMAYKDSDLIINSIKESVEIEDILKPIYNLKAGDENE